MCTANGSISVASVTDNSVVEKYEVVVAILACKDLLPSQELIFQMSMGVVAA